MRSNHGFLHSVVLWRLGIFLALMVAAVGGGLYFGKISVPAAPVALPTQTARPPAAVVRPDAAQTNNEAAQPEELPDPPVFLHVGGNVQENWETVRAQLLLASEAGINQIVAPLHLDWSGAGEGEENRVVYQDTLGRYLEENSEARLLIWVNLNPPVSWLERNPGAAIMVNESLQAYPSIGASLWLEKAKVLLEKMILEVEAGPLQPHIVGYGLSALMDQRWMLTADHDESEANTEAFRAWLRRVYASESALRYAWGREDIDFDAVRVPKRPDAAETCIFLARLPEQQPLVDFYNYCSEQVADALAGFASLTARVSTTTPLILAPYGFSYEALSSASGQFGVELLLESDLTGLVSPVSYLDRGLGGAGGMMGAIDSLKVRGKTWYIIDDTRTGVERDPESGEFERIKGIRAEDVYEVQRRNFSMAAVYGLGLIWSDPQGEGWLNDQDQWRQFEKLARLYAKHLGAADSEEAPEQTATLTVVVDEPSNFFVQCAERLNTALLQRGRDAALRAGVTTQFHLLRDVIEGVAPPTPVYLFLNAFHLTESDRARLHSRFATEQASAIWLYAPGYFGATADVENISATTGMAVRAFDGPAPTGSKYILSGQYMQAEQPFGGGETWDPLFYIEPEEDIDFLAHYQGEEKKGSIAVLTLPEGWASVYIAEPELTPALLSELLRLLEQHLYPNPAEGAYFDAIFARDNLMALHASRAGKRSLYFGHFCDVEDLLDPSIGWFQKDSVLIPLRSGETRLLWQKELQVEIN